MNTVDTAFDDETAFQCVAGNNFTVICGDVRFPTEASRFVPVTLDDLVDDNHPCFRWTGERLRWYRADNTARQRPLDQDELIDELQTTLGYPYDMAEWVACFESRARRGDIEVWERLQAAQQAVAH